MVACLPACNEGGTIAEVLGKTIRHVDQLIVVDDGSEDDTALIAENSGALVIQHGRNLGKGVSLRRSLDCARKHGGDIVVTLDGDGQHDPDEIPKLIRPILAEEADIVLGSRTRQRNSMMSMNPITFASNRVVSWVLSVRYGGHFTDIQTGFRALSGSAVDRILPHLRSRRFEIEQEIFCKAESLGLVLAEVPVKFRRRDVGRTKFTFFLRMRSLYFALKYFLFPEPVV